MDRTTQTAQRRTARRLRADRVIFHSCTALLCCALAACGAQTEPAQTAQGGNCGLDLDAQVSISVDGSAVVFVGRAADFHPMPCAAPERTCSPWRATAECKAPDGFTRQTWTLDGNEGAVTLETETRGAPSTTLDLTLAMVSR
jgi:hypothetical protein